VARLPQVSDLDTDGVVDLRVNDDLEPRVSGMTIEEIEPLDRGSRACPLRNASNREPAMRAISILSCSVGILLLTACGHPAELEPPGAPLPIPATPAAAPAPPPFEPPDGRGHAQEVLALLRGERFEELAGMFSASLRDQLTVGRLEQTWESLLRQLGGEPTVIGPAGLERAGEHTVGTLEVGFPRARVQLRVSYDAEGRIDGLFFVPAPPPAASPPPPYADPEGYHERDLLLEGEWPLPGTLTLPRGAGPFPAVVLVHGSGPHDRDQTVGHIRPFRDLALGLASRGVAVFRYEKRTLVHGPRMAQLAELTVREETVEDAAAAVRLLARLPEIDARRVVVLGHSLGGALVPRIAEAAPEAAGFVAVAAPGRPLHHALGEQVRYLLDLGAEGEAREALEQLAEQTRRLGEATPRTPSAELPLGLPASYWLDLRGFAPAEAARRLDRPLLVVHAGRDYQVGAGELEAWRRALRDRPDARVMVYPELNHLLIAGEGMATPAEYARQGYVAAGVVEDLAAWVHALPPR